MLLLAHSNGDVFGTLCPWTFMLRFGQSLGDVAPGLLTGVLLAGMLQTPVASRWLRACLDTSLSRSMPRAAFLGLLTPVGALGALPIATQLLRARVRPSVVVCFLSTAGLLMPWSYGYAADEIGILNTSIVLVGGVLAALLAGAVVRLVEGTSRETLGPGPVMAGPQLIGALRAAARLSAGWLWGYVAVAIGCSAALAAMLEPGSIEAHLGERSVATLFELALPSHLPTSRRTWRSCWQANSGGLDCSLVVSSSCSTWGQDGGLGTLAWCFVGARRREDAGAQRD